MAGDVGGSPGFLGAIGSIVSGIAGAIRGWLAITAEQLLKLLNFLKDQLITLSKQLYCGLWELAKKVARNIRTFGAWLPHAFKEFVLWSAKEIGKLHDWLKDHLGPVLKFIDKVRKRIDDIYKKYVRPVLDVIDFVRQLNRVLEVFHIDVLSGLDSTLAEIERRINEPFDWARKQINRIDNFLDRVIGLDGLFQRVTMLTSLSRYRASWIAGFWNGQIDGSTIGAKAGAIPPPAAPEDPDVGGAELAKFYQGQSSDLDDALPELLDVFIAAAGGRG